ncbi:MAG: FMN-binding protein, partial [Oscillospiraceae bacterium]
AAGKSRAKAAPAAVAAQPIGELEGLLEQSQAAVETKKEDAPAPKTAALEKEAAAPKTVWSKKAAQKPAEPPKEGKGEAVLPPSAVAEAGAKEEAAAAPKKTAGRRKAKAAPAAEGLLQASELMDMLEKEPQAKQQPAAEQAAVAETAALEKEPAVFKKIWSKKSGQSPLRQQKEQQEGGEPPQKPAPKEKVRAPKEPKEKKPLPAWSKPVISMALVCLAAILVAVLANISTASFARQNAAIFENANRAAVLPAATGFEDITPSPLPANITAVYKAVNDAGYVIESYGNGYGGQVPAVVGFTADGEISGVKFLTNHETPGLGQSLYTHQDFAAQFTGLQAAGEISTEGIDALAGATSSTNAAMSAVNAAVQYYYVEVQGGTLRYDISDEVLQQLMPQASAWETLDVRSSGVAGAYLGDDGTYVIVAQAAGEKQVTVAVALDQSGTILDLWLDTSAETEGIGREISDNTAFINQFLEQKNTNGVDTIAGATHTTGGVIDAVDIALKALSLAKEAA